MHSKIALRRTILAGTWIAFMLVMCFLIPARLFAADFTAVSLGDYGNATVMEVSGNYNAKNADGTINAAPRQAIAHEFYKTHKDEYDFLVIFTNFDFQMPEGEAKAFYEGVKNDVQGIGVEPFDNTSLYGSNGVLQGTVDMGNSKNLVTDPLDPKFEETLYVLSHEMTHRWAVHAKFKDANGAVSPALLGKDSSHWSYLLDTAGSVMYGSRWQDNGNGTFTSLAPQSETKFYSPLDLYLMGMIDKSRVPPMLLIENPDVDPAQLPKAGDTISGTAKTVTIDDIIAAMGDRIPSATISQKSFKTAFIYITTPGTFSADAIYQLENIRSGFVTRHSILTDGQSIMQVASTPKDDIPSKPVVLPPSTTPRTLPPDINDGVQWLMAAQQADGSWMDLAQTMERDTSEAVLVLRSFGAAQANYQAGLTWLGAAYSGNIDYLSRKIEVFARGGGDLTGLVQELISNKNPDGGWGSGSTFASNAADTALAVKALSVAGYADQGVLTKAMAYLKLSQKPDGGWTGNGTSTIQATADVLSAFNAYRQSFQLEEAIGNGITWLLTKQNSDGGFGNSPSTVYDTAVATMTLRELNVSTDITNKALTYLLGQQSENGSWNNSVFQTALAVDAVTKATVDPDLSITPKDITVIPAAITSLPSNIVINANISNLGQTSAQARVVLREGDPVQGSTIGEQTVVFTGQQATTITFATTVTDGNDHVYTVIVDPDNRVTESNKGNNGASKTVFPEPTHDFELLPGDVSITPASVDMLQDVKITAKIRNKGTLNAYNVKLRYFFDLPGAPFELATLTIDMVPANGEVTKEFIWRANNAGTNMPLTVQVDPYDDFTELSETNNMVSKALTVNTDMRPNLFVSPQDIVIAPSTVNERGNAVITAKVKNDGLSPMGEFVVKFTARNQSGSNIVSLGTQTIPSIASGESKTVSIEWMNITRAGDYLVFIQAQPLGLVSEISDQDNEAFLTLHILSLPDLMISSTSLEFLPSLPKEGDTVTITVTVQNTGEQTASNVLVKAFESGAEVGAQTITSIPPLAWATASLSYPTTGKQGIHEITVTVDPDNAIVEQREDNNSALRNLNVQNANLWVTEAYISPNGDGVKDSTQLFFRLESAQTLTVTVMNKKNELVRTFSKQVFDPGADSSVTWDGLNDKGNVVADGQYQLNVMNASNSVLGSLSVTIDNNNSPLTDALGTKYLLNTNLTCALPDIDAWQWFPDETGIEFSISAFGATAEYPVGIYIMSPEGKDIQRLVPYDWGHYTVYTPQISPDGSRVAFNLYDCLNRKSLGLWVVDRDGANLTQLVSLDTADQFMDSFQWSPESKTIVYSVNRSPSSELWTVNMNTGAKAMIDTASFYFSLLGWAPAGDRFSYFAHNGPTSYLQVSDRSGAITTVMEMNVPEACDWLTDAKMVCVDEQEYTGSSDYWYPVLDTLWLLDLNDSAKNKKVFEYVFEKEDTDEKLRYFISPDKQTFVFRMYSEGSEALSSADLHGDIKLLHEYVYQSKKCEKNTSDVVWSPDSAQITAITGCNYYLVNEQALVVLDAATLKASTTALSISLSRLGAWFSDGTSIIAQGRDGALYVIDAETLAIRKIVDNAEMTGLSPKEHYIAYSQGVSESSVCFGKGGYDIWAISSLLNLKADLRAVKDRSAILLKGTTSDLNFEGYSLEYADSTLPDSWNAVEPHSSIMVLDDTFTTWVPPYVGSFNVRLTATDKAGNADVKKKKVSWGLSTSISNLYMSEEMISPLIADGVKDTVELHYRALEPVHLEFSVRNEQGALVRMYYKNHTASAEDHISWDGRDESGMYAPDGNYTIKVLDYEFNVEIDNTPPDVNLTFGKIQYLEKILPSDPTLSVTVSGRAYDKNIKQWKIQYGEGENPRDWVDYENDSKTRGRVDDKGNVIDEAILGITDREIASWTERKMRIVAEDFAGNITTATDGLYDEQLIFNEWGDSLKPEVLFFEWMDNAVIVSIPKAYAYRGYHMAGGIETIRARITHMVQQYWTGDEWVDAAAVDSQKGEIDFMLDNSRIPQDKGMYAFRLKALDANGSTFYSNQLLMPVVLMRWQCSDRLATLPNFPETSTPLMAWINPSADIVKISLKYETLDGTSTKYLDTNIADGEPLLYASISLPMPAIERSKVRNITIIVEDKNKKEYSFVTGPPEPGTCAKIELEVDYRGDKTCGLNQNKPELSVQLKLPPDDEILKSLSYYIDLKTGVSLTVHEIDLTQGPWHNVFLDTTSLAEGGYPVRAVLEYQNKANGILTEISSANTLTVDRGMPVGQIAYPSNNQKLCAQKYTGSGCEWQGVPLGIVKSQEHSLGYGIKYGFGVNPLEEDWQTANTRTDKCEYTEIHPDGRSQEGNTESLTPWDVSNLTSDIFSLKLFVVDLVGNVTCDTTSFTIDTSVKIEGLTIDKPLFSPNGDGVFDDLRINYQVDEPASLDIKVFKLRKNEHEVYLLEPTPLRTIVSGLQHAGGNGGAEWDGFPDSGSVVPDGIYAIALIATDACGNTSLRWRPVEVDNTPPTAVITYPNSGDSFADVIIEVNGSAEDAHFNSYALEAGEGDGSKGLVSVNSGTAEVKNSFLGKWNTTGKEGLWTLRLTANDKAGNTNVLLTTINLSTKKTIITDLDIAPKLFSPNNDGKLESSDIKYEIAEGAEIKISILDVSDAVRWTNVSTKPSLGKYELPYDGKDGAGIKLTDGVYTAKLTAALLSNPSVTQTEKITFRVDTTMPAVDITSPVDKSYLSLSDLTVTGAVSDVNMAEYSVTCAGCSSTSLIDRGTQSRVGYTFGFLNGIAEGDYTLAVKAKDLAENEVNKDIAFTIDRTPPAVKLDTPKEGEYHGTSSAVASRISATIGITGGIVEKNLEVFTLRYGPGESPAQWTELVTGAAVTAWPGQFTWKVGKNDGVPDGLFTLSLYAKDKAGLTSETRVKVVIDNTPPVASITLPQEGAYITGAVDVKGAAFDLNLDKYLIELSEGKCDVAFKWAVLKSSTTPVQDGALANWQAMPADGDYCLRVTATDKAGSSSEAKVNVNVDTHPPAPPVLIGIVEGKVNANLTWSGSAESDLAGFNVYRAGEKINGGLVSLREFREPDVAEGNYDYTVKAADFAGNESGASNVVKIRIDLTGPDARIRSLQDGARVGEVIDIKGVAFSADDFKQYRMYAGAGLSPAAWSLLASSSLAMPYGTLAQWDTLALSEDIYSLKLEAEDRSGNISIHQVWVYVDNTPPAAPVLLSVTPSNSDAAVAWRTSGEGDLAGYLLYRNSHLANVAGKVSGDLSPYLVTGPSYADQLLPDGEYVYYLIAMDQAGNGSDKSNELTATIDTRAPSMTIVEPSDGAKFDSPVMIKAESSDFDIASVQFRYKRAQDSVWLDLGSPVTKQPYIQNIDPVALGLVYGEYHLAAAGTDRGGKTDASPSYISLIYSDLTPSLALKQPYTPTERNAIQVQGGAGAANSLIEIFAQTVAGYESRGAATADGSGTFEAAVSLVPGENRLFARATDSLRESRKDSGVVVVVYNDVPGAPTGLTAQAQDRDVHLAWTENAETDILGYNLYRDGVKVNTSEPIAPVDVMASSFFDEYSGNAWLAMDTDPNSYWSPRHGTSPANPAWWEADLEIPVLISHVEIHWGADTDTFGGEAVYAGKDFELQVWSGYAWITQAKVTGNASKDTVFDFKPSYRTDRIRIYITDSTDQNSAKRLRIAEVSMIKDTPIATSGYADLNLPDKQFSYTVTSVDQYGFESPLSDPASVAVGDIVPPSAPQGLTAIAAGSSVALHWTANAADTAGYRIYRYSSPNWVKVNTENVTETVFTDPNMPNDIYIYRITAVDIVGNESAPSNEASATVSVLLPEKRPNLAVSVRPGTGLIADWTYDGSPAGFNVYRSTIAGGPYSKVTASLISGNSYVDILFQGGVTYYYVVAAVDFSGNAGAYSNEAFSTTGESIVPLKPVIFFPTVTGLPVTLDKAATDISGRAVPGSLIDLFENGALVNRTTALLNDSVVSDAVGYDGNGAALSPDGKTLAYTASDFIWLKSIVTGSVTQAAQARWSYTLVWSPDSGKIAYTTYDNNGNPQISVYDLSTESSTSLTNDNLVFVDYPSWSPDGKNVLFVQITGADQGVWMKDLVSGTVTNIISTTTSVNPKLSPDGKLLAYFDDAGLYLFDMDSKANRLIDDNTDAWTLEWSPDGKTLAFVSYRNGSGEAYLLDIASGNQNVVPGSSGDPYYLTWTADGGNIIFDIWDESTGAEKLWMSDVHNQDPPKPIMPELLNVWYVGGARTGQIVFIDMNEQNSFDNYLFTPQGAFSFSEVALSSGENLFTATAGDGAGNLSEPSDSVSVTFDASRLPDLAVTTDDVYLYPPYPIAGEQMSVNVAVKNEGGTDASNVTVNLYVWNSHNELELLKSETIPVMTAGASALVSATWDSAGKTGDNRLVAAVDSADEIAEGDETNNLAIKDFFVADTAGLSMSTALENAAYGAGRDACIAVTIRNSGPAKAGILQTQIEDENGYSVSAFGDRNVTLAYATTSSEAFTWNTGTTYAGSYVVHSVLKDASDIVIAENLAPFTIVSDTLAGLTVVTDKFAYGPQENVATTIAIRNRGTNSIIPALEAKTTITDAVGTVLYNEVKTAYNLQPRALLELNALWNTGPHSPGDYTAVVEVSLDSGQTTTQSAAFKINASSVLTGTIMASPSVVALGTTALVSYSLSNSGNVDALGHVTRILVIDPETGTVMQSSDETADIARNGGKSGQSTINTNGYGLRTYTAVLQSVYQELTKNLATSSFTVKDLASPIVIVSSPATNTVHNGDISLSVLASDNASGVESVEYQRDGGAWRLLALADPSEGRYTASWSPTASDNGGHTLSFRAWDKAGNTSVPVSVNITIQIQTDAAPPVLTLSTLPDGAYTNNAALNITGTVTDNIGVQGLTINDATVTVHGDGTFSHIVTLASGANTITTVATDVAGNTASDTRTIILDLNAPRLVITNPSDTSVTNIAETMVTGTVDDASEVAVTVRINGGEPVPAIVSAGAFSLPVTLVYDLNSIAVTATDLANNTSTAVRSVTLDNISPALAITSPSQDIITNQSTTLLQGTVADLTIARVLVSDGTNTFTPAVLDGTFQQQLAFSDEKTYAVIVTATDVAGNMSLVQRNIIYDKTPPAITIDPVTTPTNNSQQLITGTMDPGALVTITSPLISVGTVSYPTATTWQVVIAGMAEGENIVSAMALDLAGNSTDPPASATIVLDTRAPDTFIASGPAALTNVNAATVSFFSTESESLFECQLDNGGYAPCSSPVSYANLLDGPHDFLARAIDQAGNPDQSPAPYAWTVDTIPPTAVINNTPISPNRSTEALLTVTGTDVISYKYQLSDGTWSSETAASAPIVLTGLLDGTQQVSVIGKDSAGNWQRTEIATVTAWVVDITPPVLTLSTLPDGAYTNNATLNISGKATDNNSLQGVTLNDIALTVNGDGTFSEAIPLITGSNTLTVTATDLATNTTTTVRTIILDQWVPAITITYPADNSVTNIGDVYVTGTVDLAANISIKVNGANPVPAIASSTTFSFPISYGYGPNTVEVTATDPNLAVNTSTVVRTVTFDNVSPALAITNPGQDITTNQASVLLQGTVSDLLIATVLVSDGTNTFTPLVINGTFQQTLAFSDEKTYAVTVTATDVAGNSSMVKRNIIYDTTPPVLTIDPVKTPTNNSQQLITGTMEVNSTVTGTCLTAVVGEVIYPTATTWQAVLAGMTEGVNLVSVTATDETGNESDPVQAAVVLDSHAPITTASPPGGTFSTALSVTLTANEAATIYYSVDGTNPSSASPVYTGPLSVAASTTVKFFSVDGAGNREAVQGADYTIASPSPEITTKLSYRGPQFIAQGRPVKLSARLRTTACGDDDEKEDDDKEHNEKSDREHRGDHDGDCSGKIAGRTIVLTIASQGQSQSCTGTTDRDGKAVCGIPAVNLPLGPATVTASFAGDPVYQSSAVTKGALIFAYLSKGSFVIGKDEAVVNSPVTFWDAKWSKENHLKTDSSSFKGYAGTTNTVPPDCGGYWTAHSGNSARPPGTVPDYMAVLMTGEVKKSGKTLSGDIAGIAIVETHAGYSADPGHRGTGTVLGVICRESCDGKE